MTEKKENSSEFWVADPVGNKAVLPTEEDRAYWIRVRGWADADAPVGSEFVYVRNTAEDHEGIGVMNAEALKLHEGLGWVASPPPGFEPQESVEKAEKKTPTKAAARGDKEA